MLANPLVITLAINSVVEVIFLGSLLMQRLKTKTSGFVEFSGVGGYVQFQLLLLTSSLKMRGEGLKSEFPMKNLSFMGLTDPNSNIFSLLIKMLYKTRVPIVVAVAQTLRIT